MFKKAKEHGDDKVSIAIQTYEMVDKHIRRLDSDLVRIVVSCPILVILQILYYLSYMYISYLSRLSYLSYLSDIFD
jgi:hypothetical protein